jgi:hypothetical protein
MAERKPMGSPTKNQKYENTMYTFLEGKSRAFTCTNRSINEYITTHRSKADYMQVQSKDIEIEISTQF